LRPRFFRRAAPAHASDRTGVAAAHAPNNVSRRRVELADRVRSSQISMWPPSATWDGAGRLISMRPRAGSFARMHACGFCADANAIEAAEACNVRAHGGRAWGVAVLMRAARIGAARGRSFSCRPGGGSATGARSCAPVFAEARAVSAAGLACFRLFPFPMVLRYFLFGPVPYFSVSSLTRPDHPAVYLFRQFEEWFREPATGPFGRTARFSAGSAVLTSIAETAMKPPRSTKKRCGRSTPRSAQSACGGDGNEQYYTCWPTNLAAHISTIRTPGEKPRRAQTRSLDFFARLHCVGLATRVCLFGALLEGKPVGSMIAHRREGRVISFGGAWYWKRLSPRAPTAIPRRCDALLEKKPTGMDAPTEK